MHAARDRQRGTWVWVTLAALAAALWLWIGWCRYPASSWNDLRLAPVLMAAQGVPVYTLPGTGALTTWMYGPVPLWAWSPAVLARDALAAVLTAGAINTALTLAAILATCFRWPAPGASNSDRALAAALTVLVWPEPAWRFLQADNVVLAAALLANLLLATAAPGARAPRWLAAAVTALALGSKQTAAGVLLAQLVWLGMAEGRAAALAHLGRTAAAGAVLAAVALAQFGARELWFGIVTVPAALPWTDAPGERIAALAPWLLAAGTAPLLLAAGPGRGLLGASHLRLPLLAWACAWPAGLAGILTTGGSSNHLHSLPLLAPALLVALLPRLTARRRSAPALAAGVAVVLLLARLDHTDHAPLLPSAARINAAEAVVRARPGEVWLPWAPLVTWFSEGRFDHTEDGIYVRFITGHPVSHTQARAHLPPDFRAMLLPGDGDWGVAVKLAGEPSNTREFHGWRLLRWEPGAGVK